jgi:predicted HTH transcriptional regulator
MADIDIRKGQTWSHQNKDRNIQKIKGIISNYFKPKEQNDPAQDCWRTEFETLLTQSKTEQVLYDFKQGFIKLDGKGNFDKTNFDKIIKTLTAMANHSPNATGYVCVGVADNDETAKKIEDLYSVQAVEYKNFKITGIHHEAIKLQGDLDKFCRWIIQKIQEQPITETTKDSISRSIKIINYFEKDVVIFELKARKDQPTSYGEKFYQRSGSSLQEIKFQEYVELFNRFAQN